MSVGDNIKRIRIQKSLTLKELAEKIGDVHFGTLSNIERGMRNPSLDMLEKIAEALGVSLDYLTGKSAKAILEERLETLNMTFDQLADKANIPIKFFDELDEIIDPDDKDHEMIRLAAITLGLDPNNLSGALSRQSSTIYSKLAMSSLPNDYINEDFAPYGSDDKIHDPEDAMAFLIKQPSLAAYGGYDPKTMSDEEIVEFANELLRQLKLLGFKYKK